VKHQIATVHVAKQGLGGKIAIQIMLRRDAPGPVAALIAEDVRTCDGNHTLRQTGYGGAFIEGDDGLFDSDE
jgi:hypothetical protein